VDMKRATVTSACATTNISLANDANPLYARGPLELTAFLISRYRKHVTT
jgi:hypothetical protein